MDSLEEDLFQPVDGFFDADSGQGEESDDDDEPDDARAVAVLLVADISQPWKYKAQIIAIQKHNVFEGFNDWFMFEGCCFIQLQFIEKQSSPISTGGAVLIWRH